MKITQRLTYFLSLLIAIINFLYTLAFSSNWAQGAARLGDFFIHAQEVNHLIFRLALVGVVLIGLALVFNTHKNRKFYPSNYIFSSFSAIMFTIISIITLLKVIPLKAEYMSLDSEQLLFVTTVNYSTPSVAIFHWGIGISIVMLIASAMIILITGIKFNRHVLRANRQEKRLEVNHDHS